MLAFVSICCCILDMTRLCCNNCSAISRLRSSRARISPSRDSVHGSCCWSGERFADIADELRLFDLDNSGEVDVDELREGARALVNSKKRAALLLKVLVIGSVLSLSGCPPGPRPPLGA